MTLTSIIITTHDRPQLLPRAVESARAAGRDVEIVVVDDASTDATADVCKSLSGINYVRLERNQGVAGARNVGLLASRGEFATFLDDDDLRLSNSIDEQVELLRANTRAGLVYGQAVWADAEGQPTGRLHPRACPQGDVFWSLLGQNFIPCGGAVFRRSCLSRVGLLDDTLSGIDDWDLWIRIAELDEIVAVERPVMLWRRSTPVSGQGTSTAAAMAARSVRQFREWMKLPRAAAAPRRMKRATWRQFSANIAAHLVWEAGRSLRYGDARRAAENSFAIMRLCPLAALRLARARNVSYLRRRLVASSR